MATIASPANSCAELACVRQWLANHESLCFEDMIVNANSNSSRADDDPLNSSAVPRSLQNPQICEGWAPPPVDLNRETRFSQVAQ